jgi:hypothetical protein
MSESTGYILAAGALTAANEAFFAPAAGDTGVTFNWRIIPATAIAAVALSLIDQLSPEFGKGLAVTALITVLFAKFGNADPPAENLSVALGYMKKP